MLLGGQTTEFHMNVILTIALYSTGVGFPVQFAYCPKATPFAGEACETNCSLVRMESRWKEDSRKFCLTVCSHLASFNALPMTGYVLRGVAWASAEQKR